MNPSGNTIFSSGAGGRRTAAAVVAARPAAVVAAQEKGDHDDRGGSERRADDRRREMPASRPPASPRAVGRPASAAATFSRRLVVHVEIAGQEDGPPRRRPRARRLSRFLRAASRVVNRSSNVSTGTSVIERSSDDERLGLGRLRAALAAQRQREADDDPLGPVLAPRARRSARGPPRSRPARRRQRARHGAGRVRDGDAGPRRAVIEGEDLHRLRARCRMTLRRWGVMGACDARRQGAPICGHIGATEDAAACAHSASQRHKAFSCNELSVYRGAPRALSPPPDGGFSGTAHPFGGHRHPHSRGRRDRRRSPGNFDWGSPMTGVQRTTAVALLSLLWLLAGL